MAFLRIVVGIEHQSSTHDGRILLHHPTNDGIERVWLIQHTLCSPNGVADSGLDGHHHFLNLQILHAQFGLSPVHHLFAYAFVGIHELYGGDEL